MAVLLVLWLGGFMAAEARAEYRFDQFTNRDGLPQNTVSAITQTRDGYLWFATYDGLVRYDGVRFTVFDKGNTAGITNNIFLALCEDANGTLWAGTGEGGMIRYRNGSFSSFTVEQGLPVNYLGRIQLAADGKPILFFDNGDKNYLQWTQSQALKAVNIYSWQPDDTLVAIDTDALKVYEDRARRRWVYEPGRLLCQQDGREQALAIQLTPDEFFRFRYEDRAGNLWFGSRGTGVYRVNGEGVTHYTAGDGVPMKEVVRIAGEDGDGNLWMFTERQLLCYRDGRFRSFGEQEGLRARHIRAVYCDREGSIWIGSNANGLFRMTRHFLTAYASQHGLLNDIVYPILADHKDNVWIGSGGGLTRFADGRFTPYPLAKETAGKTSRLLVAPPTASRPRVAINALCEDRRGGIWLGINQGLWLMRDGKFTSYEDGVNRTGVDSICQDRAGDLWVGTFKGLYRHRDGVFTYYGAQGGMLAEPVNVIYEDRRGDLWVGTRRGLAKRDGDGFRTFTTADGLVGNRIRSLYGDEQGALWIGTFDSGISRYKDGQFTSYTTENGLFNNGAFQILEDHRGNFWVSCNRGIYRVSRQQLEAVAAGKARGVNSVVYGIQDGMLSTECNGQRQPAGGKTGDGRLWFPTQGGVVVIDPDAVPYNAQTPLPVIESVVVDGGQPQLGDCVTLQTGQRDLEIAYSAPSSLKAASMQFKYKLVGLHDEWRDAGTQRVVRYSHLPPGSYTFTVIAANSDGIWSENGATLAVEIKPYFYQTNWFYALCGVAAVLLAAAVYGWRVRRLKASERRLTRLVGERTAELVERTAQLEVANDKLQQLATLDPLTNLANRRRLMEFLAQQWQAAQRRQAPLSLLLLDVDHFKAYNDTYGHQGGDDCLRQVAAVMKASASRATDLAARYGGEEFAVVLADTDATGALSVAESIRSHIEALRLPHSGSKVSAFVTVSLGVATLVPESDHQPEDLIALADQALYGAKEGGRNTCRAANEAPGSRESRV